MRWIYDNNKWSIASNNILVEDWLTESNEDYNSLEFWSKCINGSIYTTTTDLSDIYPQLDKIKAIWAKTWNGEIVEAVLTSGGTILFTQEHLQQTGDIIGLLDLTGDIRGDWEVVNWTASSLTINQQQPIVLSDTQIWVILYGETRTAAWNQTSSYIDIILPEHKSSGLNWKIKAEENLPILNGITDGKWLNPDTVRYFTAIPNGWNLSGVTVRQDWDKIDIYGPISFSAINYASSITITLSDLSLLTNTNDAILVEIEGQTIELKVVGSTGTTIIAEGSLLSISLGPVTGWIKRDFITISDWKNIYLTQNDLVDQKLLSIINRNILMLRTAVGDSTQNLILDTKDLNTWSRTQLGHFQPVKSQTDEFSNYTEIDLLDFENIDLSLANRDILVDGLPIKTGQLLLLAGQTDLTEMGVWRVEDSGITRVEIDPIRYIVHVRNGLTYNATKWELIQTPWGSWDTDIIYPTFYPYALGISGYTGLDKGLILEISGETREILWKTGQYLWTDHPFTITGETKVTQKFEIKESDPRLIRNRVEYRILSDQPFSDIDYSEIYDVRNYNIELADFQTSGGTSGYTWHLNSGKLVRTDLFDNSTISWGQIGQMPQSGTTISGIFLNTPSRLEGVNNEFWITDNTEIIKVSTSAATQLSTLNTTIPYILGAKVEDIHTGSQLWWSFTNNKADDINFNKTGIINQAYNNTLYPTWEMPDNAPIITHFASTQIYNGQNYIVHKDGTLARYTSGNTWGGNNKIELTVTNKSIFEDIAAFSQFSDTRLIRRNALLTYGDLIDFNLNSALSGLYRVNCRVRFQTKPTKNWNLALRVSGTTTLSAITQTVLSSKNIEVDKWYNISGVYSGQISKITLRNTLNTQFDQNYIIWVDGVEVTSINENWIEQSDTFSIAGDYLYNITKTGILQQRRINQVSGWTILSEPRNILSTSGNINKLRMRVTDKTTAWVITDGILRKTSTLDDTLWNGKWDYNTESILVIGQGGTCLRWRTAFEDFKIVSTKTKIDLTSITSPEKYIQDRDWKRQIQNLDYYIVGNRGALLLSNDGGNNWKFRQTPTYTNLTSIDLNYNYAVIVGEAGYMAVSTDLINWNSIKSGRGLKWNRVKILAQDLFIAVGESGQIGLYQLRGEWTEILGDEFKLSKIENNDLQEVISEWTDIEVVESATAWFIYISGRRGTLAQLTITNPPLILNGVVQLDLKFWRETNRDIENFTSLTRYENIIYIGNDTGEVLQLNTNLFTLVDPYPLTNIYEGKFITIGNSGKSLSELKWSNIRNSIVAIGDEASISKWEFSSQPFTGSTINSIIVNPDISSELALLESGSISVLTNLSVSGNTATYSQSISATTFSVLRFGGELDSNLRNNFLPRLIFTDYFLARKIRIRTSSDINNPEYNVPQSEWFTQPPLIEGDIFEFSKKVGDEWNWIANESYLWTGDPLSSDYSSQFRFTSGQTEWVEPSSAMTTIGVTSIIDGIVIHDGVTVINVGDIIVIDRAVPGFGKALKVLSVQSSTQFILVEPINGTTALLWSTPPYIINNTLYFSNWSIQGGEWIELNGYEFDGVKLLISSADSSSITFNQTIPTTVANAINDGTDFKIKNLNLSPLTWDDMVETLENHPIGKAYEIEILDGNFRVSGKIQADTSYWYLESNIIFPTTTGETISYGGEQYGPNYTLVGLLEPSLGLDNNYLLDLADLSGWTYNNVQDPLEFIFADNIIYLGSGITNDLIPGIFYDIYDGTTLLMDRVFIRDIRYENNRYRLETDCKLPIGISNGTAINIMSRKSLGQVSSDLRLTDNRGIALTYFDLIEPGIREMRTQFDIRLSGWAYANILANDINIQEKTGLIISEDRDGLMKARLISWTNDPNLGWSPSDTMIAGVDGLPRVATAIDETNYFISGTKWGLVGVDDNRLAFRLVDGLSISRVTSEFAWIINADIKGAVIGLDENSSIVWYKGEWICGRWFNGTWWSGTAYNISWENGEWYSRNVTEEDGRFIISPDYDITQSTWLNGEWYRGTWYGGNWYNGVWYGGTWSIGKWFNGTHVDGLWLDGEWSGGLWKFGTWQGGIFNTNSAPSIWEAGRWLNGDFENGLWKSGIWQSRNITENGRRLVSRFGTRASLAQTAIWENGVWRSGEWHCGLREANGQTQPSLVDKNSVWKNGVWLSGKFWGGTWELGTWYSGDWYRGVMGRDIKAVSANQGTDGTLYWIDLEFDTPHFYKDPSIYNVYYGTIQPADEAQYITPWGRLEEVNYNPYTWAEEFGHSLNTKRWRISKVIDSTKIRVNIPQDLYSDWTTGLGWNIDGTVSGPRIGPVWNSGTWRSGIFRWGVWNGSNFPQGYFSGVWNGNEMGI